MLNWLHSSTSFSISDISGRIVRKSQDAVINMPHISHPSWMRPAFLKQIKPQCQAQKSENKKLKYPRPKQMFLKCINMNFVTKIVLVKLTVTMINVKYPLYKMMIIVFQFIIKKQQRTTLKHQSLNSPIQHHKEKNNLKLKLSICFTFVRSESHNKYDVFRLF